MSNQYPAIPDPQSTVDSLRETVLALKEAVENLVGTRGPASTTIATSDALSSATTSFDQALAAEVVARNEAIAAAAYTPPVVADLTLLSNISGAPAAASPSTLTALLDAILGNEQGALAYRESAGWTRLLPGVNGQFLKTQGAGDNPVWAAAGWQTKTKAATQSFTNNTTLTDDPVLSFPIAAGQKFLFRFNYAVIYGTGGQKFLVSAPTGSVTNRVSAHNLLMLSQSVNSTLISTAPTSGTFNVGFQFYGYIENGSTSGDVVMQIAQSVSSAIATQYLAGSYLEYMQVS